MPNYLLVLISYYSSIGCGMVPGATSESVGLGVGNGVVVGCSSGGSAGGASAGGGASPGVGASREGSFCGSGCGIEPGGGASAGGASTGGVSLGWGGFLGRFGSIDIAHPYLYYQRFDDRQVTIVCTRLSISRIAPSLGTVNRFL